MYLDVKFQDGTVTHIAVSNSHTVRIISPSGDVQDAFAFGGVAEISLDHDGAPQATDPAPVDNSGAAEGPTVDAPAPSETPQPDPAPVAAAEEPAAPDTLASDASTDGSSDAPVAASGEPTTDGAPAASDGSNDPAHDPAVAAAAEAVATVVTSDAPVSDHAELIAKAQADVDAALAQWPDSQPLQDAKTDLEQLAAEAA